MDCSLPGFSVHGISQARTLEWAAVLSSRGSSWPRDWTVSRVLAGRLFIASTTWEAWETSGRQQMLEEEFRWDRIPRRGLAGLQRRDWRDCFLTREKSKAWWEYLERCLGRYYFWELTYSLCEERRMRSNISLNPLWRKSKEEHPSPHPFLPHVIVTLKNDFINSQNAGHRLMTHVSNLPQRDVIFF